MVGRRASVALLLLVALASGCSSPQQSGAPATSSTSATVAETAPTTTATSAAAPGEIPAAATTDAGSGSVSVGAVDDAVAAARVGALATVDAAALARLVRGACAAHLAGLDDAEVQASVAEDLGRPAADAGQVVRAARAHMCP